MHAVLRYMVPLCCHKILLIKTPLLPKVHGQVAVVGNASVTVLGYIHRARATAAGKVGLYWMRTPRMYGVPSGLKKSNNSTAQLICRDLTKRAVVLCGCMME